MAFSDAASSAVLDYVRPFKEAQEADDTDMMWKCVGDFYANPYFFNILKGIFERRRHEVSRVMEHFVHIPFRDINSVMPEAIFYSFKQYKFEWKWKNLFTMFRHHTFDILCLWYLGVKRATQKRSDGILDRFLHPLRTYPMFTEFDVAYAAYATDPRPEMRKKFDVELIKEKLRLPDDLYTKDAARIMHSRLIMVKRDKKQAAFYRYNDVRSFLDLERYGHARSV